MTDQPTAAAREVAQRVLEGAGYPFDRECFAPDGELWASHQAQIDVLARAFDTFACSVLSAKNGGVFVTCFCDNCVAMRRHRSCHQTKHGFAGCDVGCIECTAAAELHTLVPLPPPQETPP